MRADPGQQDQLGAASFGDVLHFDNLMAPETVSMILWKYLARSRFALALDPTGKEMPVDPDVTLTITLVRCPILSPSSDGLLVDAQFIRQLPGLIHHR